MVFVWFGIFFLSFLCLHTNLWHVLFVSLVAGWITGGCWREDDWCLLPVTCQFLQPSGNSSSSCGFCCLYLKTQQYFAIVGQWMWKQSQRNLRTNSEHYSFANFVCLFSMHVLLLPCQDFLPARSGLLVSVNMCTLSTQLMSVCLSVSDWPEQAQVPTRWFWCLFQALQLNYSPSPYIESFSYMYVFEYADDSISFLFPNDSWTA